MPALSISWWLAISASAGVSLTVRRWNCDRRIGGSRLRGEKEPPFCHAGRACQARRRARSVVARLLGLVAVPSLRFGSGCRCRLRAAHLDRGFGQGDLVGALGVGVGAVGAAVAVLVRA